MLGDLLMSNVEKQEMGPQEGSRTSGLVTLWTWQRLPCTWVGIAQDVLCVKEVWKLLGEAMRNHFGALFSLLFCFCLMWEEYHFRYHIRIILDAMFHITKILSA